MATQTQFKQADLVSLLEGLGFGQAAEFSASKMNSKFQRIAEDADNENSKLGKAIAGLKKKSQKATLAAVLETLKEGNPIEFAGSKKKAKEEGEPKAKKPKGEKKEAAGTDAWGARLGSKRAAMNAAFTKKPQSMKEICEKAGCKMKYNHVRNLIDQGKIVQTDDGQYSLA